MGKRYTEVYKGKRIDIRYKTAKELVEKVAIKKKAIDEKRKIAENLTLAQWTEFWLREYKVTSVSYGWYKELERRTAPLLETLGHRKIENISQDDLRVYLNRFHNHGQKYIKANYSIIRDIFKSAYLAGKIKTDPSAGLTMPQGKPPTSRRSLTAKEQALLLDIISGSDIELPIKLMLYCGLRPGELLALTWGDIDTETGTLSVTKAVKKDGVVGPPKTASGNRTIPIPRKLLDELKPRSKSKSVVLVTPRMLRREWENARNKMCELDPSIPKDEIQMYMLRHTYCTNLEKKGVPINVAKSLMGHSSIHMTAKIYTHFDEETIELARELIDG